MTRSGRLTVPHNQAEIQTIIRTPVARVIFGLIADPPPIVKTHTRAAVSCGELDSRAFQRALDLGQGLDHPADRAIAMRCTVVMWTPAFSVSWRAD